MSRPKGVSSICQNGWLFTDVAKVMFAYMAKFKMPQKARRGMKVEAEHSSFIDDLITECENYVIENPVRLRMPLDLGYMQTYKFDYQKSSVEHINKFYGKDYTVVWVVHHMFKHVVLYSGLELKKRLFRHIEKTGMIDYLEDLAPGDYFYLLNNKYVITRGIGRFRERPNHYTQRFPKKTFNMQYKGSQWRLFVP